MEANNVLLDPQSNLLCHVIHKPGVIDQLQPEPLPEPHAREAAWEGGGAPQPGPALGGPVAVGESLTLPVRLSSVTRGGRATLLHCWGMGRQR